MGWAWTWTWTTHEQEPSFEYRPSVKVIKINANGWVPSPPPKKEKMPPFFLIYWVVLFPFFLYVIRAITLWTQTTSSTCKMHVSHYSFSLFFYKSFFFLVCGLAFLTTKKARKSWGENSTGRKRRGNNQSPAILSCCWLALYLIHHLTHNLLLLLFQLNQSTIYS